jgi:hypothetical protein
MNLIQKAKSLEISEMYAFLNFIEEYGHIFDVFGKEEDLDVPFDRILKSMEEIKKLVDDCYGR